MRFFDAMKMRCRSSHLILVISNFVFASCASDPSDPQAAYYSPVGSGGYIDSKVADGLYRIEAKGRMRSMGAYFGEAQATWTRRANELCGSAGFRELEIKEYTYEISGQRTLLLMPPL